MDPITAICITCCKADVHLARICVASVRYWYPELPIYLIKDGHEGGFCTRQMERAWNVTPLTDAPIHHGWGFAKLEALWCGQEARMLLIDCDTVLLGRVVEALQAGGDSDFVVAGQYFEDPRAAEVATNFYDWARLQRLDPTFRFPGYCFNTGQLVATTGVLAKSDFDRLVCWNRPTTLTLPETFHCGEQGVLNYVLQRKEQEGGATVTIADFGRWAGSPETSTYSLEAIRRGEGYPYVLHWAGPKPPLVEEMVRADILKFFEDRYYERVPAEARWRTWEGWKRRIWSAQRSMWKKGGKARQFLKRLSRGEQLLPRRLKERLQQSVGWFRPAWDSQIQRLIWDRLKGRKEVYFLQVGANDGVSGDPIHNMIKCRRNWRGIFVEPVTYIYERLRRNMQSGTRYVFENVAIAEKPGTLKFYHVSDAVKAVVGEEMAIRAGELGSLSREQVVRNLEPHLEQYVIETNVESLPLNDVLTRNRVRQLDLLCIDTEGYDYNVLKQLDFSRFKPAVILYEHKHLPAEEKRDAEQLLAAHGYELIHESGDTLGML